MRPELSPVRTLRLARLRARLAVPGQRRGDFLGAQLGPVVADPDKRAVPGGTEASAALPVTRPVVAEGASEVVASVPRRHPLLRAPHVPEVSQAADHHMAAAGILRRVALARLPGHLCGAQPPRVPEPALFRDQRKT